MKNIIIFISTILRYFLLNRFCYNIIKQCIIQVMRPCDDVFLPEGCWWNFKQVNCCEIFELQRTEFGLCHSFNSDFSEYGRV